jgi:hypothetical protein
MKFGTKVTLLETTSYILNNNMANAQTYDVGVTPLLCILLSWQYCKTRNLC